MKKIVIVGAGGFGRELLAWVRQSGVLWPVKGFIDDNPAALSRYPKDVGVIGSIGDYQPADDELFVCAMGQIEIKRRVTDLLTARGANFVQVMHGSAVRGIDVVLGEGVILCPHAVVASDARLGDFVTVNMHSTVDHDATVGRYSQLHCHVDITGGVTLGEGVLVGSHATVLPGVKVGDGAIIGAGSVVTADVPPGTTVFGVPARPYRTREVGRE